MMSAELAKGLLPGQKLRLEFGVLTKTKSPSIDLFIVTPDRKRLERMKRVAAQTKSIAFICGKLQCRSTACRSLGSGFGHKA